MTGLAGQAAPSELGCCEFRGAGDDSLSFLLETNTIIHSFIHSFIHVLWHLQGIQDALDFYILPLRKDIAS
jgi:hypothetical protein